MSLETRIYPLSCQSMNCGKSSSDCATCVNSAVLDEFKQWVAESGAVQVSPIWNPTLYKATKLAVA